MADQSSKASWFAKHVGLPELALFTAEDIAALEPHLEQSSLRSGEVLFKAGQIPEGVWILKEGSVGLSVSGSVVGVVGAGSCIGDAQVLVQGTSPFEAKALEDCNCLFVPQKGFLEILEEVPAATHRWASKLAVQLVRMQLRVCELLGKTLPEQIARTLINESIDGVFPHSQEMLAAMLGSHRSPLNQVLKELERKGLLRLGYRKIEITNQRKLQKLAKT